MFLRSLTTGRGERYTGYSAEEGESEGSGTVDRGGCDGKGGSGSGPQCEGEALLSVFTIEHVRLIRQRTVK